MTGTEESGLGAEQTAFRIYASTLYGRPGLTERLLALQDEFGADINLVLFCCYQAGVRGCILDRDALIHLTETVSDWRETVIGPLRALRRQIKRKLLNNPSLSTVYEALLVAEIEAEHVQQDMLVRCEWGQGSKKTVMSASEDEKLKVVQSVLLDYFGLLHSACDRKCIESARYIAREAVFCTAIDGNP